MTAGKPASTAPATSPCRSIAAHARLRHRARRRCALPVRSGGARGAGRRNMTFPGLRAAQQLAARRRRAPARADPRARRQDARDGPGHRAQLAARRGRESIAGNARPGATERRAASADAARLPADTPVGLSGLERVCREPAGRARPAGCCWPATACSPAPQPRRRTPCAPRSTPASQARGGRPRSPAATAASPRSTRAPARCCALAGHRLLGAPAARLDVQDHHATAALEAQRGRSRRPVPGRRPRRRSTASTSRTPTASPAAARFAQTLRPLVQLGLRAARREFGARAAGGAAERFGFNEPPVDPRRAGEHDPGGRRDRRRRSRSARRRSARARCWPRRCRWRRSPQTIAHDGVPAPARRCHGRRGSPAACA